ncbi:MAG: RsmE family RNA methyltransferase [Verrucomicrobiota bacterium]
MKRYFHPKPEAGVLDEAESHHCAQVMRQKEGDFLTVFDGRGLEVKARIAEIAKQTVRYEPVTQNRVPPPAHRLVLAQALAKHKAMDLIIQKATELGVSAIAPLASDRCVSQLDDDQAEGRIGKWRAIAIEAAKQSGQNWLPEFAPVRRVKPFLAELKPQPVKLIASLQPEAQPLKATLRDALAEKGRDTEVVLMIGPEGDFTPAEIGEARATGFLPVSLGEIVLRSETAAIFTLSSIIYELS